MDEKVIMQMITERINPKMKETFESFLISFRTILTSQNSTGIAKWTKFQQNSLRLLKSKKAVWQIFQKL